MGARKIEKVSALVIGFGIVMLSMLPIHGWTQFGIYPGCSIYGRFLYPFFHAGLIHAGMNAWCFVSLVFIYDISKWRLLLAYLFSVSFPIDTFSFLISSTNPTVGLSGMIFFLMGSISFEVSRRLYFQGWMIFYLSIGFLFPYVSAWIHLYGYCGGLILALLNKPIRIRP